MYSYETRVVVVNKKDTEYLDYLNDRIKNRINTTGFPRIEHDDYIEQVMMAGDFDRMMKHFDVEWLSDTERQSETSKIIFKKADEIKRLEAEIEKLTKILSAVLIEKALSELK